MSHIVNFPGSVRFTTPAYGDDRSRDDNGWVNSSLTYNGGAVIAVSNGRRGEAQIILNREDTIAIRDALNIIIESAGPR